MDNDVRNIVNGFISAGDYEKALSLLKNFAIEDDADKAMLATCKQEYAKSCKTALEKAVESKDKNMAESILRNYEKYIGEDANTVIFRNLVDGIKEAEEASEATPVDSNQPSNKKDSKGKWILFVLGSAILLIVITSITNRCNRARIERQEIEAQIEQARQDSIESVERARNAAIEMARRARQDSIDAARRREQARLDSIDYAEHAGFVSKYAQIGLIITNVQMTRGSNNDGIGTKGVKFSVFNPTHKTIKYVIVTAYGVNIFDDRITGTERLRGIGPVDPHDYATWDFDDVFTDKNDVIDDINVSFRVEYTNGTAKNVRFKDAYVSDFKTSWFENR